METKKLSLEELLGEAAPETEPEVDPASNAETPPEDETPAEEEAAPETPSTEKEDPKDPTTTTTKVDTPAEDPAEPKKNPVKELRERLNQEQRTLKRINETIRRLTTGNYDVTLKDFTVDGEVDYDALSAYMDEQDVKAKAEQRGISPEVQAEIDRIEKEKLELEKEKLRVGMERALTELQIERNLKASDINTFFKDSLAVKKNPYAWIASGGTLDDLYHIVYREQIIADQVKQAVEAERVKWDAQQNRTYKKPTPNPATPKDTAITGDLTMEQLLAEAAKRQ